jgi:putative Mn2+ efflux pump MntP
MAALLVLAFALGLDSFRAATGLGLVGLAPARQAGVVFGFGVCDGLAVLAGAALGRSLAEPLGAVAEHLGPLILATYGVYLIALVHSVESRAEVAPAWLLGLPIVLSADNLVGGVAVATLSAPVAASALAIGVVSALMALAGLRIGIRLRTHARGARATGAALVVVALSLWLG